MYQYAGGVLKLNCIEKLNQALGMLGCGGTESPAGVYISRLRVLGSDEEFTLKGTANLEIYLPEFKAIRNIHHNLETVIKNLSPQGWFYTVETEGEPAGYIWSSEERGIIQKYNLEDIFRDSYNIPNGADPLECYFKNIELITMKWRETLNESQKRKERSEVYE